MPGVLARKVSQRSRVRREPATWLELQTAHLKGRPGARRRQGSCAQHWPAYLPRAEPWRWSDNGGVRRRQRQQQPGALETRGGPHHLGGMLDGLGRGCAVLETTRHRAMQRTALRPPRPRPVPRPARAAITALPGPAWMRSRARPSAPARLGPDNNGARPRSPAPVGPSSARSDRHARADLPSPPCPRPRPG